MPSSLNQIKPWISIGNSDKILEKVYTSIGETVLQLRFSRRKYFHFNIYNSGELLWSDHTFVMPNSPTSCNISIGYESYFHWIPLNLYRNNIYVCPRFFDIALTQIPNLFCLFVSGSMTFFFGLMGGFTKLWSTD